jgi:hypothetical protein
MKQMQLMHHPIRIIVEEFKMLFLKSNMPFLLKKFETQKAQMKKIKLDYVIATTQ